MSSNDGAQREALVTVVVPSYNGALYVREAIQSALHQTHPPLEVLVVDDGSTDGTPEIVRTIGDIRVRLIEQPNGGVAAARNTGVAAASGEFIAFLDQDDVWFEDKLRTQLPYFDNPVVGLVGSLLTYLGSAGAMKATSGLIADEQQQRIAEARLMPFAPSSMVVRTSAIRAVSGFDASLVREVGPIDDLDLVARIAKGHTVQTVPRSLGYYRIHSEAGSFAKFHEMQRGTLFLQARFRARALGQDLLWPDWSAANPATSASRLQERARFLYRQSGMLAGNGQKLRASVSLGAAALLSPRYVLPRLRQQLRR